MDNDILNLWLKAKSGLGTDEARDLIEAHQSLRERVAELEGDTSDDDEVEDLRADVAALKSEILTAEFRLCRSGDLPSLVLGDLRQALSEEAVELGDPLTAEAAQ